jgi:2,4-dienoyl-CoA reductase-like NADH-dependent reductase (Old Yellow Enzyme family)
MMAVGLITEPRQADAVASSGQAYLVALERGMLSALAWHAAMDLGEEVYYPPQYECAHPKMAEAIFSNRAPASKNQLSRSALSH